VVSAYINTTVNWESADSKTKGSKVVTRGHFVQFQNPLAAQVMKVDCDKPCLVMLYNPGRLYYDSVYLMTYFCCLFSSAWSELSISNQTEFEYSGR